MHNILGLAGSVVWRPLSSKLTRLNGSGVFEGCSGVGHCLKKCVAWFVGILSKAEKGRMELYLPILAYA